MTKRFADDLFGMAVITAFDPGGTTGWAVLAVPPRALEHDDVMLHECLVHVDYGQIDCGTRHGQTGVGMGRGHDGLNIAGETDGIVKMLNIWDDLDATAIVFEDFVLDMKKANMGRDLLTPVRIIAGFSTLLQYSYGPEALNYIFIQNRSLAKTTCTDERLMNWGLYDRNSGPHARDAVRHAFYFLRSCRGADVDARYKRFLVWPYLFDDPQVRPRDKKGAGKAKSPVGQRIRRMG